MAQPLRVLIDATHFWPGGQSGGIKPALREIIRWLGQLGGNHISFVFITSPVMEAEVTSWLRPCDKYISQVSASPDIAAREKCDVVYCPFGITDWTCPGIPTITLIVDLLHLDFPETLEPIDIQYRQECLRLALERTDVFQVISNYTSDRLQFHGKVDPGKIIRTYLPIQSRLPSTPRAHGQDLLSPYFFYPANAWTHKNHQTLLVAYAAYYQHAKESAWRLVLTGHPDHRMAQVQATASALEITAQVDFLGYVDDARLSQLWHGAGALVFPSLHEGFGIPLLEAMAHGIPILASNDTAIPEITGQAALLVDCRAPQSLAEGMLKMTSDANMRQLLVQNGYLRLKDFSPEREFGQLLSAFTETAGHSSRFRCSGYHNIDRLIDPVSMYALPETGDVLNFRTRPLGVARTIEFWSGKDCFGSQEIAAHKSTEGCIPIPKNARVLTIRVPNASRLSVTDPRTHGVLLDTLSVTGGGMRSLDLLKS